MMLMVIRILLLLLSAHNLQASAHLRFSEPLSAREFFERCDISETLSAYCAPEFNLEIPDVYVGCGGDELHELERDPRLRFAQQFDARAFFRGVIQSWGQLPVVNFATGWRGEIIKCVIENERIVIRGLPYMTSAKILDFLPPPPLSLSQIS